jgi:hypothetical protein
MSKSKIVSTFTAALLITSVTPAFAVTEISWWHAMTGANNEVVDNPVEGIQRQPERLQGDARLQGHLSRNTECRHRGVPRQAGPRTSCRCLMLAPG